MRQMMRPAVSLRRTCMVCVGSSAEYGTTKPLTFTGRVSVMYMTGASECVQ